MVDLQRATSLLLNWARWAERWWYQIPGQPGLGCFGTGYNGWGVQTNQKYVAAMAVLAGQGALSDADRAWARERALAALRFSLASHKSGDSTCTDNTKWGHTWISALGVERMMHGVAALDPHLTADDRAALQRMLSSEADWLLHHYKRGPHAGIQADKWGHSGKNDPESNLWNGCVLWRAASMYPNDPRAADWRERALRFLAAGVSVEADAKDATIYDGLPLRERYAGPSFFDSYALDHHGYFNVGYMIICVSHAAIMHFDAKQAGFDAPQLLHLHQEELWSVIRPMIFEDGRLCRIGGDSRVRYAYCQEYLPASLLYAADHLGDATTPQLIDGILRIYEREAANNGDGSFYGKRLAPMARMNPYYYVRIEGDRASALSMLLAYAPLANQPAKAAPVPTQTHWIDEEYGAAFHRSPTRIASFAWRAYGLSQGMCLPPDASDLAEWEQNLAGEISFAQDAKDGSDHGRRLVRHAVRKFDGGFITTGTIAEGAKTLLLEGWSGTDLAMHYIAFVALPDDHTVVGIQFSRLGPVRAILRAVKGMRLNVPNDLFNEDVRTIEAGKMIKLGSPARDEVIDLDSRHLTVDGKLSAIGLYGADSFRIDRSAKQRGGGRPSLLVDQICWGHRGTEPFMVDGGNVLLDVAWMVGSSVDAARAADLARANANAKFDCGNEAVRGVAVVDANGRRHAIVLNVSEAEQVATFTGRKVTLAAGAAETWEIK